MYNNAFFHHDRLVNCCIIMQQVDTCHRIIHKRQQRRWTEAISIEYMHVIDLLIHNNDENERKLFKNCMSWNYSRRQLSKDVHRYIMALTRKYMNNIYIYIYICIYIYSETCLNLTLKNCLNQTDLTVPCTKFICNLDLHRPNTCLN